MTLLLNDYAPLYDVLQKSGMASWVETLPGQIENVLQPELNGHWAKWNNALASLPQLRPSSRDFASGCVRIGVSADRGATACSAISEPLKALLPWRKGPFNLFGVEIDAEWRSDYKWARLSSALSPLQGRRVLDVGSGNGYYLWRMLGAGVQLAVGIDPFLLYTVQFAAIKQYVPNAHAFVIPLGLQELIGSSLDFDTIFSMGVLYHVPSPIEHIMQLKPKLNKDRGELVLETIVVDGPAGHVIQPHSRYAKMRNVSCIPSSLTVEQWLKQCQFGKVDRVHISRTTIQEQRSTPWMPFESLSNLLDKDNSLLTCEGYPAPQRAVFIASL